MKFPPIKTTLIGLCGYSKVGKDTAALGMGGWFRSAFADELKADLQPLFDMIALRLSIAEHKEMARPMLVEWGRLARKRNPLFWIDRLFSQIDSYVNRLIVITDVRYMNEVQAIEARGGTLVYIERSGFYAANKEEEDSITEIRHQRPGMIRVVNDGVREVLGPWVLEAVYDREKRDESPA